MDFSSEKTTAIFLVNNGSLRPDSTLSLRRIAHALSSAVGRTVEPVSLLHSGAVDAAELGGRAAEILEPAIRRRFSAGVHPFGIVPLFFGPSAALTEYLPERMQHLAVQLPGLRVTLAGPVVDSSGMDRRVSTILAERTRETMLRTGVRRPVVIVVDHGSPQRTVVEIRNLVACQLGEVLHGEASTVLAASMERRPEEDFAFNEPLLARALTQPPCGAGAGDVVVAQMFFSPGRHAGPDGDIAQICQANARAAPGLRVHITDVIGEHPLLIQILVERVREVIESRAAALTPTADCRSARSASRSG